MRKICKSLVGIAVFTAVSGCLSTTGNLRTITSAPAGALVKIDGYGQCETPCTIKLDQRRDITVAKAGYKAQRFGITSGKKDVHVILQLAAPTSDIDTQELPEL